MPENREEQKRLRELEKIVKAIYAKADAREKAGRNPEEAGWQATLEIMLLLMDKTLQKHPGQLLPVQISNEDEEDFFIESLKKIDFPPDTHAVLYTPSAFKDMPFPKSPEVEMSRVAPWQRNAYSVIVSDTQDHSVVIQASLPGLEYAGIDIFDDGVHCTNYNYNTIEECLRDLSGVIWNYFHPRGEWTQEQIAQYTENWFVKNLDTELNDVLSHKEYSYIHHPELLGLTPLNSVFKLAQVTVAKEYHSLDDLIELTNELNEAWSLGELTVTKSGIFHDKEPECKALVRRISVEIDQTLEILDYVDGITMPSRQSDEYRQVFYDTARRIYEKIVARPWPESISLSNAINGDSDLNDDENDYF
ncbi:MAG: hypothetical protein KAQ71_14660 [Desulfobulbaceae bacterium]|nr:hypothetical protein [Desulfobulbaceae bacterium]